MKKISLCVLSYNRPDTLRQVIASYLKQDYKNKELVISDDTKDDSIEKLVKSYKQKTIKYFHNEKGLGFARNLLKVMERATGDYLVILGDDDLLVDKRVLSDYVKVFDHHPTVGFVYSNQVQFSNDMDVQYVINFFSKNKQFKKGKEAMQNMWVKSIFIGGIGIRNSKDLSNWYPKKNILHPQVEFIGHIINQSDAYLIAKNHIGVRSHEEQLIFTALKDKKVKAEGEHMTVELHEMFGKLKKEYNLPMTFDFAARELIAQQMIMMFKEKSFLGNREMEKNYRKFCSLSPVAKNSPKFTIAFWIAKLLPGNIIMQARSLAINLLVAKNKKTYVKFQRQLQTMTTD